jgi:hypothetical protein
LSDYILSESFYWASTEQTGWADQSAVSEGLRVG